MAQPSDQTSDQQATSPSSNEAQFTALYFGFASNLSPRSLQQRCPGSLYIGLARLTGWRFIITTLGFGNIVPGNADDEVYGSLHFLTAQHEAALDKSEEVPRWHIKRKFSVEAVPSVGDNVIFKGGEKLEVMTYVDIERTTPGHISKEYIFLMRKAVRDGQMIGVPNAYFDKYWASFLPEDETGGGEEKVIMMRTVQMDKEDLRYVPREMLKGEEEK